jgi:dihydroxyacetone kinase phosphotransfer subunit
VVGLVVISHSMELAEAVVALVNQVGRGRVQVVPVGGTGDPAQPFGSDAVAISKAILQAHSPDGVVVLMDLGSSVMSAELALELLPEEIRAGVYLCPGPLVEGAVVAGIQASCGSSVERVLAEANEALQAKALRLESADRGERESGAPPKSRSERREIRIGHPEGLHARPAAEVV